MSHATNGDRVRLQVRLPVGLHATLVQLAQDNHRSLNSTIVHLLEYVMQQREEE